MQWIVKSRSMLSRKDADEDLPKSEQVMNVVVIRRIAKLGREVVIDSFRQSRLISKKALRKTAQLGNRINVPI